MALQALRMNLQDLLIRENIILETSVLEVTISLSSLQNPEAYLLGIFLLPYSYSFKYLPAYFAYSCNSWYFNLSLSYLQELPAHLEAYQKWVASNYSTFHIETIPPGSRFSYRYLLALLYANGYSLSHALKRINRLAPYLNLFRDNQERLFKNPLRIGRMLILEKELQKRQERHEMRFLHQLYLFLREQYLTTWELNYFLTLLKSRGFLVHSGMDQEKLYEALVSYFNWIKSYGKPQNW